MEEKTEARIYTEGLGYQVENASILNGITLQIKEGEFVGLIGPNGCGKTTLLKNIYRIYKPTKGAVFLDGKDIRTLDAKAVAREMAVLAQEHGGGFDFPIMEIVLMGRYAHKKLLEPNSEQDRRICEQALEQVGMSDFKKRSFLSLSGGEKQRVLLAAAFAQEAGIIVLDEPTNHLDVGYQLLIMDLIKNRKDTTVFSSVHDMNIAARYCDRLIAMKDGGIVASGAPEEVLTNDLMRELFHVQTRIEPDPETGKLQITFVRVALP